MSIVKQDWLVKNELDPNRLAYPNPKVDVNQDNIQNLGMVGYIEFKIKD